MALSDGTEASSERTGRDQRSIDWVNRAIVVVDQCALPHTFRRIRLETVDSVIDAITRLAVRGAPAIGVAGALGVALSARAHAGSPAGNEAVRRDADRLIGARPTAVNLEWGVRRALNALAAGPDAVLAEARAMLDEDEQVNVVAARRAADLLLELCGHRALNIATHCNTGRLATVAEGTALGAIKDLARRRHVSSVLVGETRPLLQGARLTAWELAEAGIAHRLCVDSAIPAAISRGMVDCVVVGADRVTANGDVANKIGTYALAVAAARHGIPFVVVAPESSLDRTLGDGALIVIEERAGVEVLEMSGQLIGPAGTAVFNPAFDVTPRELVTAVVSELAVYEGAVAPGPPSGSDDALSAIGEYTRLLPRGPGVSEDLYDLSPLYAQRRLMQRLVHAMAAAYEGRFDRVLAVGGRGLVLGALVAQAAGRPLATCSERSAASTPACTNTHETGSGAGPLRAQDADIAAGSRVLLVCDVLAAGDTIAAAASLVEACDATVAGLAVALELAARGGRPRLGSCPVFAARSL